MATTASRSTTTTSVGPPLLGAPIGSSLSASQIHRLSVPTTWATASRSRLQASDVYTSGPMHAMTTHSPVCSTSSLGQTLLNERVLGSSIVGETVLGRLPQLDEIQYVEVPVVEEVRKMWRGKIDDFCVCLRSCCCGDCN